MKTSIRYAREKDREKRDREEERGVKKIERVKGGHIERERVKGGHIERERESERGRGIER